MHTLSYPGCYQRCNPQNRNCCEQDQGLETIRSSRRARTLSVSSAWLQLHWTGLPWCAGVYKYTNYITPRTSGSWKYPLRAPPTTSARRAHILEDPAAVTSWPLSRQFSTAADIPMLQYSPRYQSTWFLWPATTEFMQLDFAVLIPGLRLHLQCINASTHWSVQPCHMHKCYWCCEWENWTESVFLKLNMAPCLQGSEEVGSYTVIIDTRKVDKWWRNHNYDAWAAIGVRSERWNRFTQTALVCLGRNSLSWCCQVRSSYSSLYAKHFSVSLGILVENFAPHKVP